MTYSQLFGLLDEAGLSPERAASRLGVSHMTLRRWQARPGGAALAPMYERAFRPVFDAFVAEGLIALDSPAARPLVRDQERAFQSVLKSMGFPEDILRADLRDERVLLDGLSKVGQDAGRTREVDLNKKKIASFGGLGKEWKERVGGLAAVIRSKELISADKFVAYGALFYLLMPFDLIPDTIPVIGLLDDFALLGVALWFYQKRFPKLLKGR